MARDPISLDGVFAVPPLARSASNSRAISMPRPWFDYAFKPVRLWIIGSWFVASSRWLLRCWKRGPGRMSLA